MTWLNIGPNDDGSTLQANVKLDNRYIRKKNMLKNHAALYFNME